MWSVLALLIAVISAVIAWAAKRSEKAANARSNALAEENNRLTQRANELQERIVKIEERGEAERNQEKLKANLKCEKSRHQGFESLVIKNIGKAKAENLEVLVNGDLIGQNGDSGFFSEDTRQLVNGIAPNSVIVLTIQH